MTRAGEPVLPGGDFFRSRLSVPLLLAALAVVAVLPFTPLGHVPGFRPLPGLFFLALAGSWSATWR
jgi:hypothetical protein